MSETASQACTGGPWMAGSLFSAIPQPSANRPYSAATLCNLGANWIMEKRP